VDDVEQESCTVKLDFDSARHSPVNRRGVAVLLVITTLLVIAAYAILLPGGRWEGDDYLSAALVAHGDWRLLLNGFKWIPRPIATSLRWSHLSLSYLLDRPLTSTFLAFLWLTCITIVAAAGAAARNAQPFRTALLLFALVLLLGKPDEMFYWPAAAAAYLPCWAGLAAATMLHRSPSRRLGMARSVALLIAVLSSEIGAATVLIYTALATPVAFRWNGSRGFRPLILPSLAAVAVCMSVFHYRMQPMSEVWFPASGLAGNWLGSFRVAIPTFVHELVSIDGLPQPFAIGLKLMLPLCFLSDENPDAVQMVESALWGFALLLGSLASVVLAYHQFGTLCCGRHAALRQGLILLSFVAFAGCFRGAMPTLRQGVLVAVLLLLLSVRAPALLADIRDLPAVIAARNRTWDSGLAAGDSMTLYLARPGLITNVDDLPPGQYHRTGDAMWGGAPWYVWGVMARFDKHNLTIPPIEK
jgi:hypothetical protein